MRRIKVLDQIVYGLIAVVGVIAGVIVGRLAVSKDKKIMGRWSQTELIFTLAKRFVDAAEESIKGEKKGADRKAMVEDLLKKELTTAGIPADNALVDAAIHYGVGLLHKEQASTAAVAPPIDVPKA
jgi:hypothetical protein